MQLLALVPFMQLPSYDYILEVYSATVEKLSRNITARNIPTADIFVRAYFTTDGHKM
jgi:hypothetical protein